MFVTAKKKEERTQMDRQAYGRTLCTLLRMKGISISEAANAPKLVEYVLGASNLSLVAPTIVSTGFTKLRLTSIPVDPSNTEYYVRDNVKVCWSDVDRKLLILENKFGAASIALTGGT
jgi:hypothetical protein